MSRVGNKIITLPSGVTVSVADDTLTVTGPKGTLTQPLMEHISIEQDGDIITVKRASEDRYVRAAHGLIRALLANMIEGVTNGFKKTLEVNGVGFRIQLAGNTLKMNLGFSHEINFPVPEDVQIQVEANNIIVSGIDRQRVGQVAADIREFKKPEPYKGKGIKYSDERIIRKAGKSGKDK